LAADAERKYEEVARKLNMLETDLLKAMLRYCLYARRTCRILAEVLAHDEEAHHAVDVHAQGQP
jgi:predicted GNAT superfamily acetyltransferase